MQVQEEIIRHKSFMDEEEAKLEQLRIKQELSEAEAEADMYQNAEDEEKAPLHQDHRPESYCYSRHVLTVRIYVGPCIIICYVRTNEL